MPKNKIDKDNANNIYKFYNAGLYLFPDDLGIKFNSQFFGGDLTKYYNTIISHDISFYTWLETNYNFDTFKVYFETVLIENNKNDISHINLAKLNIEIVYLLQHLYRDWFCIRSMHEDPSKGDKNVYKKWRSAQTYQIKSLKEAPEAKEFFQTTFTPLLIKLSHEEPDFIKALVATHIKINEKRKQNLLNI